MIPDDDYLRQLPSNLDAEAAVISLALSEPTVFDETGLAVDQFYSLRHRDVWAAIADLVSQAKTPDVITVSERLIQTGSQVTLADVAALARSPGTLSGLSHYTQSVKNAAKEREIIHLAAEAQNLMFGKGSTDEKLDAVSALFNKIEPETHYPEQLNVAVKEFIASLEDRSEGRKGLPTGINSLDDHLNGLNDSDLILLAARPAMGKTCLALNIAVQNAVLDNTPTLFFSLEMSRSQLVERCASNLGSINLKTIRRGDLTDTDWPRLSASVQQLKDKPLYIDDTAGLTLHQLRARARAHARRHKIKLIVIDYLQLIRLSGRSKNEEVGEISRSLKELAKELNLPVLCLSQLNRDLESRPNKRPRLSDLRDSGSLEQDADVIMFVYRDEVYDEDSPNKGVAELLISKFRNGEIGTRYLTTQLHYQRFTDLDSNITPINTAKKTGQSAYNPASYA